MVVRCTGKRMLSQAKGANNLHSVQAALLVTISIIFLLSILLIPGCVRLIWGTPQATFTFTPGSPYPYQPVKFDASACFSEKDKITQYAWTFGDGGSASGTKAQHVFTAPGDYTVCLTITTEHGQEASVTYTAHIAPGLVASMVYPITQGNNNTIQLCKTIFVGYLRNSLYAVPVGW